MRKRISSFEKKIQQILQRGRMCAPTKNWPAGARDSSRGTVALRIRAGKAAITVKALRYLCPHVEQAVCPGICHMGQPLCLRENVSPFNSPRMDSDEHGCNRHQCSQRPGKLKPRFNLLQHPELHAVGFELSLELVFAL